MRNGEKTNKLVVLIRIRQHIGPAYGKPDQLRSEKNHR
jgi:hypothetical protein